MEMRYSELGEAFYQFGASRFDAERGNHCNVVPDNQQNYQNGNVESRKDSYVAASEEWDLQSFLDMLDLEATCNTEPTIGTCNTEPTIGTCNTEPTTSFLDMLFNGFTDEPSAVCPPDNNNVCDTHTVDAVPNHVQSTQNVVRASTIMASVASPKKGWQPIGGMLESTPQYHPQAITDYLKSNVDRKKAEDAVQAKRHLLSLGWRIERKKDSKKVRFRYFAPDGKSQYYSLSKVCLSLQSSNPSCGNVVVSTTGFVGMLLNGFTDEQSAVCPPNNNNVCDTRTVDAAPNHVQSTQNVVCASTIISSVASPEKGWQPIDGMLESVPQYHPQAITDYLKSNVDRKKAEDAVQAKRHLLSIGWRIERKKDGKQVRFRYITPDGKSTYYSLSKVCLSLQSGNHSSGNVEVETQCCPLPTGDFGTLNPESRKRNAACNNLDMDTNCIKIQKADEVGKCFRASSSNACAIKKARWGGVVEYLDDSHKLESIEPRNRRTPSTSLASLINSGVVSVGEKVCYGRKNGGHAVKTGYVIREGIECLCCRRVYNLTSFESHAGSKCHRPAANIFLGDGRSLLQCQMQIRHGKEVKGSKEGQHKHLQSDLPHHSTRQLMHKNNILQLEGHCPGHKHVQSNLIRPYVEHLEHDQSILQSDVPHARLQQMGTDTNVQGLPCHQGESSQHHCEIQQMEGHDDTERDATCSKSQGSCDICCCYGEGLVVCQGECQLMFHFSCLGLKVFPDDPWFCPSCGCGICGRGEYNNDGKQFVDETILYCDQCNHGYHVGCLRGRGHAGLESCPEGNWFCSRTCSEIFASLESLLGRPFPTEIEGLTWTILRPNKKSGRDQSISEAMTQHKLRAALHVLRECFPRIVQPLTKSDLVTDVLFNNEYNKYPQLNNQGFYTMILEREGRRKPITVLTFRIHGGKLAEVPFVGTCSILRRRGMCRCLMYNLEQILLAMKVERLLLPAVPTLLDTWINSFNFHKLTASDRFELLGYDFLKFSDAIMCQKLITAPSEPM